jgi:hypothetical protein
MGGDQPDWTELGKIPSAGGKRRGPSERAPDWHQDPQKLAAKARQDALDRGELVVAVGPFCVPCGKRFAKQTVYDAHLSGKKHLAALRRMGREEEAMVCQIDMEAKRRRLESNDAIVTANGPGGGAGSSTAEDEAAAAARKAEREQKLLERAMLPMPSCVTATSVYTEGSEQDTGGVATAGGAASSGHAATTGTSTCATTASATPATDAEVAAAAAGTLGYSYTHGLQETGAQRTNRHTTPALAEAHRRMAAMDQSWAFLSNPGGAPPSEPMPTEPTPATGTS